MYSKLLFFGQKPAAKSEGADYNVKVKGAPTRSLPSSSVCWLSVRSPLSNVLSACSEMYHVPN